MDDGFKYIEAKGDASESSYSYTGKTGTCSSSKQSDTAIAAGKVTSFSDVTTDSETQMLAAVTAGPVSVAIEADQSGFQFYKSGVVKASDGCGSQLNHAVVIVGYSSGDDSGPDPSPEPTPPTPTDCTVTKWWHSCEASDNEERRML